MEASMLFTLAYLRGVKSGMIGTCCANRGEQTKDSQPDLHVPSIDRQVIQKGVLNSIRIALEAISFLSESKKYLK